jgi:hypothetical protein
MRNPAQPRCIRTEISAIIQIAMAAQKLTTLNDRNANSVYSQFRCIVFLDGRLHAATNDMALIG